MKRASFLTNAIMAIMIVVLGCTLLYTVFSYRSREQERTDALREEAERMRQEQEPAGRLRSRLAGPGRQPAETARNGCRRRRRLAQPGGQAQPHRPGSRRRDPHPGHDRP